MAVGDTHFPEGGATHEAVTSSTNVNNNGENLFVDTSEGAITLTVQSGVNFFTVYDSHFNFGANNCTVDFGGGSTRVMNLDGEIMTFFRDANDAWRYISVSVGSGGSV